MQSEKFDNKIREAAGHHQPAYDEKAWGKMEKLLNKYLPQEGNDRRRYILFFLLFLLLGGGIFLFINKPWQRNTAIAVVKQGEQPIIIKQPSTTNVEVKNETTTTVPNKQDQSTTANSIKNNLNISAKSISKDVKLVTTAKYNDTKKVVNAFLIPSTNEKTKIKNDKTILTTAMSKDADTKESLNIDQKQKKSDRTINSITANTEISNNTSNNIQEPVIDKELATAHSLQKDKLEPVNSESPKTTIDTVAKSPSTNNKKIKNKKTSSFYFSISAGPDVSFAGSDKIGKARLQIGAGIGYNFNSHLTIRTGIYSGRKIYAASPDQYHPPVVFWSYYTYLQKIDADCKVIEIPLSVNYNFGKTTKQNWFVSTGLSSYFMKKESYTYYYKQTPSGQTITGNSSIENMNKHYFSILNLSGGYQRNISKYVSILVEPYIKLPLSGIGYGKVKLNSGGLIFSVAIKPFAKNKK